MNLQQINWDKAIGTLVFVMAFDAVASSVLRPQLGLEVLLALVNFPGFILLTALAWGIGAYFEVDDEKSKFLLEIAALYSAAFWSLMIAYVFQPKHLPNHSQEPSAADATSSAARSDAQAGGGSPYGR
jgi:hypothetical protein